MGRLLCAFFHRSRVKFMLESLLAIKNNNMRKMPACDTLHLAHLKKVLRSSAASTKSGSDSSLSINKLRISYTDLLQAKSRGKWWVVGSAWQGSSTLPQTSSSTDTRVAGKSSSSATSSYSKELLALASKLRMNTDSRKSIFCTVMSADDYMDAFEKVMKLGLSSKQQNEILVVILECCSNENQYNAYYTHLINKFISHHRRYLVSYFTRCSSISLCNADSFYDL